MATRPWPITEAMLMMLPPPWGGHAPRALEGHEVRASEIHPGDRIPVLLVVLEQRLVDDDAGIVDEHVDAAERLRGPVDAVAHRAAVRHVEADGDRFPALGLDLARERFEPVHAPSGERHPRSLSRRG